MSQNKRLLITGMEQHLQLSQSLRDVIELGSLMALDVDSVKGQEAFMDSLQNLGSGLLSVTKWVGGKALSGLTTGFKAAGSQLSKTFDDNKTLIRKVISSASDKEEHSIELSAAQVALITSQGDHDHIGHDMDVLLSQLEILDKHSKEVLDHLDAQLIAVRKLKDAKHTDDVFAVIDAMEKLKYPAFKLPRNQSGAQHSAVLPGGKEWTFNDPDGYSPKYSMSGDSPAGEGGNLSLSKSQIAEVLNKLDKVNSLHQRVKDAYDGYLAFLKSWAEMVKVVDEALGKLEFKVSKSALKEAEKLLEGNHGALAFYSGFTPRVVGYTDRYIHGVLGVFA
jgi:hypothetical protein